MTYEEMIDRVMDYYSWNEEDFNNDIESLDSWKCILDDDRVYDMYLLDDMYGDLSLREFMGKVSSFYSNAEYFKETIHGIETCYKKDYSLYLTRYNVGEIYENRNHLYVSDGASAIFDEYDEQEEEE